VDFSTALCNSHEGQVGYIIGKGPSLDHIDESYFPEPGPKLVINEGIRHFESIDYRKDVYSLQQDGKIQCMVCPYWAPLILSQQSDHWFPYYSPRYIYNQVRDLNIIDKMITAVSAIELARIMGCRKLVFIAFDACTENNADYPSFVKWCDPANSLKRFRRFYDIIRLSLRGFTADFINSDGSLAFTHRSAPFTVITLTGDRQVPFKLCKKWVLRQTLLPSQWLVVDDGKRPLSWSQWAGADYHRRKPHKRDPSHTIRLNMLEALKYVKYDRVIIMEDDDWYHPKYCETLFGLLNEHDLVGETGGYYYYWPMSRIVHVTSDKHAALFKTGFNKTLYPVIKNICQTIRGPLIDMALWRKQELGTRLLIPENPPLSIGMKGLLGRPGTTSGWKETREGYQVDENNIRLRTLIGDDVEVYKNHFAQIQRRPMKYEDKEDKLYSWLWETGPYAKGVGVAPRLTKFASWAKAATDLENQSILDLGCGKGEMAQMLPYRRYMGIDISTYQIEQNILQLASDNVSFLRHSIDRLPFEDMSYDLAICQDVMEHIPMNRVDRVLREMFRAASAVMLVIDCKEARLSGPNGEKLHCTIQPVDWWRDRIRKLSIIRYEDYQDFKLTLYCGSYYKTQGTFPEMIHGARLRRHPDGSVWMSKKNNKLAIEYMDVHFLRVGRELRWHYPITEPQSVGHLKDKYKDMMCYIVGKGPSLDNVTEEIFEPGRPIICINESIHKIESLRIPEDNLFLMQQDTGINCRPLRATPLLYYYIKHLYPEIAKRYIFSDKDFGRQRHGLTVLVAIAAAKYMGCSGVGFVSFDACVNKKTSYAKCIGHPPSKTHSGDESRFLQHRQRIEQDTQGLDVEWIIP